ncbi:MAG TPA: diguanylate cyclase [Terriglobales bacterium]|nr:diguanylate cyclase [Terriglobales bacterium]
MERILAGIVIVPGVVALLLFLVFTYLYQQSRQAYFRAWQIGWGAYCAYYALVAMDYYAARPSAALYLLSDLLLVGMAMAILISTRLMEEKFRFVRSDHALAGGLVALAVWGLVSRYQAGVFRLDMEPRAHLRLEVGIAAVLLFCALRFYRYGRRRDSLGYRLLSVSLILWAVLLSFRQFHYRFEELFGRFGHFLGPVPQMLLGIGMLMVLFENDRRAVQENALAFSTLEVDTRTLLSPEELSPGMEKILNRLARLVPASQAFLLVNEHWRAVLPSARYGLSDEFLHQLEELRASEYLSELAYRGGGIATLLNLAQGTEPVAPAGSGQLERLQNVLVQEGIRNLTALNLQTRENTFGVIVFPHAGKRLCSSSQTRLLLGVALQIGMTLENYVVMHEAHRRSKEYELLTEIGKAISSRLDKDEILLTVQKELGQLFDTSHFYIAFQEGEEIRFELEFTDGHLQQKRSRKVANGITEYIIRTGQPLLVRSGMDKTRERIGARFVPGRPAKCFAGVPIFLSGKPAGAMAAMNVEREFVYEQRDLELLRTVAGQVAVAVENARLFADQQERARHLAFLNSVSKTAISSEDAQQMLAEIVGEIQKNFQFDHIGIGILDYATKDIEIKAEAGTTAKALGKRIPLGVGIVGRVARTNEVALVQNTDDGRLLGILRESRSVLCLPITYGDSMLGVLNVESQRENAFSPQDVLIMNTLADLLATALHNAFVVQKLQQQSITDGLTGIKTRRFFWEALTGEWRRASRSGRPFSVVMIDLDKFKEVNDSMGHLEGDLVLARVGRLLEQKCRQSNVVARYGGDEFVILMPETGVEQAQILSERLRLWIATDPMLSERQITGSFGVASFPLHGSTAEDCLRVADAGMYVSKHAGGNRVSTAEEYAEGETLAVQRQLIAGYIEGFLQREHTGPEYAEELVVTLKKFCGPEGECRPEVLKEAIEVLCRAAETREVHAASHGEAVAKHARMVGRALGMEADELADLVYAGRVHDVGKIFLPEKILNKPGGLTEDEYYLVKMHPKVGGEILATIPGSRRLREWVEHHHENFDGSGYPAGLRGEEIPLGARILHVADAYVNMTTERPFAAARTPEAAMAELEALSGTQFDGMIVRILARQLKAEKATTRGS